MQINTTIEWLPRLYITPLATVKCIDSEVIVEVDDENKARVRLIFKPYQAFRMITADCFYVSGSMSITPQSIMLIQNSTWVSELSNILKDADSDANFMEKAQHFLLPLQDSFLEIVAWDVLVEDLGK